MTLSSEDLLYVEGLKLRAEGDKLLHDTMKQLATFSSAAIVLVVPFVVPFVKEGAHGKALIAIALVAFLICIISAGVCMRTISLKMGLAYSKDETDSKDEATKQQRVEDRAFPIAVGSFVLAIGIMVVFVFLNLSWGFLMRCLQSG